MVSLVPADYLEKFRQEPAEAGFVLDFDGTLAEVVPHPSDATALPGAAGVLEALARTYAVVAVVSGRRAGQVQRYLKAGGVRYVGLYGAEELAGGRLRQPPQAEAWRREATRLAAGVESFLLSEGLEGCWVEVKDLSLSVHFRNASAPEAGERILRWARDLVASTAFVPVLGRMVVELRPQPMTKAAAVEAIVSHHGLKRLVIAGDDSSDLEAFHRAKQMLGAGVLVVGVGSEEQPPGLAEGSDLLVGSPKEVLGLLEVFGALPQPPDVF
ncbi:MAG: trehalose-phosphatase [Actinomycetota bacterium]